MVPSSSPGFIRASAAPADREHGPWWRHSGDQLDRERARAGRRLEHWHQRAAAAPRSPSPRHSSEFVRVPLSRPTGPEGWRSLPPRLREIVCYRRRGISGHSPRVATWSVRRDPHVELQASLCHGVLDAFELVGTASEVHPRDVTSRGRTPDGHVAHGQHRDPAIPKALWAGRWRNRFLAPLTPRSAPAASPPALSSPSDGSPPSPRPSRRGSTRRTARGRASAGPSGTSRARRRRGDVRRRP